MAKPQVITQNGSSLFSMDKVIFNSNRAGFYEDIHTKQRRAQKINSNLFPLPASFYYIHYC